MYCLTHIISRYPSVAEISGECPAAEGTFTHMGVGCCRGENNDFGSTTMDMHSGIGSLAECQQLCIETQGCSGIELNNGNGDCEVSSQSHVTKMHECSSF